MMNSAEKMPEIGEIPVFPKYEISESDWRSGLVLRSPNWLGDAVMTLPAIAAIKKALPEDCKLFMLAPSSLKEFYQAMPIVDRVICLQNTHRAWQSEEIAELRSLNAGAALLFNNSLRDVIYFRRTGIPRLFGAAARARGILMTRAWRLLKKKNSLGRPIHHAAKYLSMAYALNAPDWDGTLPEFIFPSDNNDSNPNIQKILETDRLLVLAPGAAYGPAKCWPMENFREVAKNWLENDGQVAVVGTQKEKDVAAKVIDGLSQEVSFNTAGETTLTELMRILNHAKVCLCNDSGAMHLAAAMGGKGVAIFGSTDPEATSPVSSKWEILRQKIDCSPCFKRECPEGHYKCLKSISPEMVIEAIEAIL